MKYRERALSRRLTGLMQRFPIVVVSGARQVGKTTLAVHSFPEWPRVTLDPSVDVGNARADPDLFLRNYRPPLIIDELQYAPELVSALKRAVDSDRSPGRYLLTGSQQWQVLRSASESLAGRAVFIDLEAFSLHEIAEAPFSASWLERYLENPTRFLQEVVEGDADEDQRLQLPWTLYEQLWRGFLPEAQALEEEWIPDFLEAYFRSYVERDVRSFGDVADWHQFGRFVQLSAALTAQEVNHSQLGREVGITPQTATRWRDMLAATYQWHEVPAYSGNTIKRISSKPKGYTSDTGLACSLQRISSPQALGGHPLVGALFETAMVDEIRKHAATLRTKPQLFHWRSHGGAEVDLVLERDGTLFPIEIKLTSRPGRNDARGIAAFRDSYPQARIAHGLVICAVDRPLRLSDTVAALPWDSV